MHGHVPPRCVCRNVVVFQAGVVGDCNVRNRRARATHPSAGFTHARYDMCCAVLCCVVLWCVRYRPLDADTMAVSVIEVSTRAPPTLQYGNMLRLSPAVFRSLQLKDGEAEPAASD